MDLVVAQGALLEQVLDLTFPVWHEGLTRQAYGRWNAAQMRTSWGRERLQRVALVDEDGQLLASAKRYRLTLRVDGRDVPALGIGAVFTPEARRGAGHASRLIERLVEDERRRGALMAMLFSEISPSFYARLSFSPVVLDQVRIVTHLKGGCPAMLVRAGHESDLPAIAAMHTVRSASARFALTRGVEYLRFILAKKRLLAGLGPPGARQIEFHVAEEGASAVAYVVLSIDRHGWTLSEAGDRDPAGARLGAMFQVLLAREPSLGPPSVRAWWPRLMAVPPQLQLTERRAAPDVLMMRALGDIAQPSSPDEVFYWRGDCF